MASTSAEKSSISSSTSSHTKSFDFSSDPPQKLVLSKDQLFYCSDAVKSLKEKTRSPDKIEQEFDRLQLMKTGLCLSHPRLPDHQEGTISMQALLRLLSGESISRFIATQGPLPQTCEDFWEMVIQYHCPVIVMLTRLVDNYKTVKCGDYFNSEDRPREFGNIQVTTKWTRTTDTL